MIRLLADENFNELIIRNLRQRLPGIDIVRVQDVGLRTLDDPAILEWAANNNRLLLTHDKKTMPNFAYQRVYKGLSMPGVFVISDSASRVTIVENLITILQASNEDDWKDDVTFLPL